MKTKILIAVTCIVFVQLTTVTAQISTNIQSGNNGSTFSVSIGTNSNQNNANFSSSKGCCGDIYHNNCNYSNNNCNHHNINANCCGQKHDHGKHKHKCKKDRDNDDNYKKKSKCCKKHDD